MFISGIASGIDTEALIAQLLAVERRPMVQMQQRKDLLGQQRDAWRDINTRLNTMRERIAALRDESVFFGRLATSTNEGAVSVRAASGAAEGRYEIDVQQLAQAHRVQSYQFQDPDVQLDLAGQVSINTKEIDIELTDSLRDIARKINEAEADVTATVIEGHLVLRASETGKTIEFEDPSGVLGGNDATQGLGITNADEERVTVAQQAVFVVEGVLVERSSNTIDDLFDGVTFTLHGTGRSVVTIERDLDDAVDKVQAFVDQYNSVQAFMASAGKSSPDASSRGILSGDGLLMRIQSQLRNGVMTRVTDDTDVPYAQLMSVGISVDRYGTMTLDETKLRDALADDPEAVHRLFGAEKVDGDNDTFDGVAVRLEETFQGWLQANDGVLAERQKLFGNQMRTIDESIERMERRLELREQSLMRQFTALEQVLATFQSQAMWLEGQIQQMNALSAAGPRGR